MTPQQQGVVLYVPTPKMTRERREHMVHDAKKVLNEYKSALNEVRILKKNYLKVTT